MSPALAAVIKAIILPPTINFILIILGFFYYRKSVLTGRLLQLAGFVSLLLLCLKPVSYLLITPLERYPALSPSVTINNERAIVVLSAGININAKEYGRNIDSIGSLQRNLYAAFLHEQTGLPVLVTGGLLESAEISHAEVMAKTLQDSFDVETVWQEAKALNTAENAIYTSELLKDRGIGSVFLVTHAWHMPRAVMMFEAQELAVTPAPTAFTVSPDYTELTTYLPSIDALYESYRALYEYVGMIWYRLSY